MDVNEMWYLGTRTNFFWQNSISLHIWRIELLLYMKLISNSIYFGRKETLLITP